MAPARRPVPADVKAAAVQLAEEVGLAEAARRSGQPKTSIRRWAAEADVDLVARTSARNREATLTAAENRRRLLAEADERAVTLLTVVRDEALQQTVQMVKAGKMEGRALIGAWTRAGHDLALLQGQATERLASEPVSVDVQVTVRTELTARLDAMARRIGPEVIDVPAAPANGNGNTGGSSG